MGRGLGLGRGEERREIPLQAWRAEWAHVVPEPPATALPLPSQAVLR